MKNISVGQNLQTLKKEGRIVEQHNFEDMNSGIGFAMVKKPNSRIIEGVMYDKLTHDVVYVFRKPVHCPQNGIGMDAPDVPLAKVQPSYIYSEFFRETIGDYFFRHHAGNLTLIQAVWEDDRKEIFDIDPLFYAILWVGNMLRNLDKERFSPIRTKLYQGGMFGCGGDNLRFHHDGQERSCSRVMVMYFQNVDTATKVPPIIVEYAFHHPSRPRPGGESGVPHTLKLSRRYYNGEWPNIKVFMDDPRNKPYLDLFYAEKA
ncbi:hypothetical protein pEaSNUABM11_00133 [Erwinia phage pEa_SNUABM_11]|nr:hypothetical protein pEaSNUABM11_00133 [Erwinia phage pEa_SNUABM_11]